MNSVPRHSFEPASVKGLPLGRGLKEGRARDTLSVIKEPFFHRKEDGSQCPAYPVISVVRNGAFLKSAAVSHVSDDLAAVARELNLCMPSLCKKIAKHSELANDYKDQVPQFVTDLNALIKKRNDKIDASGWIAFLDVVLKILTLGLFHYKESLKAPLLNPIQWQNAFNPEHYKFVVDQSFTWKELAAPSASLQRHVDLPAYEAQLLDRFFYGPESNLPISPEKSVKTFMGEILPLKDPREPLPLTARSEWNEERLKAFAKEHSAFVCETKAYSDRESTNARASDMNSFGVVYMDFLRGSQALSSAQILSSIDDLFNQGTISNGIIILTDDPNKPVRIAVRKVENEQFAILVLSKTSEKTYSYKVGTPLDLCRVAPERVLGRNESVFLVPLDLS